MDDDQDLADLIRVRLEAHGYGVEVCENGTQALEALHHGERPHAIVMDIEMPQKNGLTALYELKEEFQKSAGSRDSSAQIPVIVITGLKGVAIRELVQKTQIYDYLEKPFDTKVLADKVARAIGECA